MESKTYPNQRRFGVPGCGLSVCAIFLTITALILYTSAGSSLSQGFGAFSSWPFSFSSSRDKSVKGSVDLNVSSGTGQEVVVSGGVILEKANLGVFTENAGNGSSKANDSVDSSIGNSSENVKIETHPGNFTEAVKDGSMHEAKASEGKSVNNTSDLDNGVRGNNSLRKFPYNVELGGENQSLMLNNSTGNSTLQSSDSHVRNGEVDDDGYGKCDIYDGRWVKDDDSKPYYPAGSCPYIDRDFDCHVNGRPDDEYMNWRWKPNGCDIPRLNATDFLERLRGKRLVFVGDSLNRNMWESLSCILRHSIKDKKKVHEISGRREFKKKGIYAFRFEDYNCSVDFVVAPFLVRESSFQGKNGSFETLRLDLMDQTTSKYHDADFIVFNTGHWWTHEKTSKGEDYYQEGEFIHPRLKVLEAYKRALTTWARWVDRKINSHKTKVFFRGYSVTHFRGGQWNSGGQCHKESEPIFNESYLAKYPSKMRVLQHVLQEMKTPVVYLNISRLTDYRKDGHPSIYRMKYNSVAEQVAAENVQDCSHWCLPGVPDTWNELLYAHLINDTKGS